MKSPECLKKMHMICFLPECACDCHEGGSHDRAVVNPPDKPLCGVMAK